MVLKPKRGVYRFNAAHQGPEEKRQIVAHHIATNGSRIQPGGHWKPGMEALGIRESGGLRVSWESIRGIYTRKDEDEWVYDRMFDSLRT